MKNNRNLVFGLSAASAVLVGAVAIAGLTQRATEPAAQALAQAPVRFEVEGLQRYESDTLKDWVGLADTVVTIRVDAEEVEPAPKSESVTGSGVDIVGRRVQVTVLDSLWSNTDEPLKSVTLPGIFSMSAWGWAQEVGSDEATRTTAHGTSRLEVGQTYVTALKWYSAECLGDPEGAWGLIGSGGVLPVAGSTIGVGEYEGVSVQPEELAASAGPGSVAGEFAGKGVSDLANALVSTSGVRITPKEPTPCLS